MSKSNMRQLLLRIYLGATGLIAGLMVIDLVRSALGYNGAETSFPVWAVLLGRALNWLIALLALAIIYVVARVVIRYRRRQQA